MNSELPEGWAGAAVAQICERVVVGFVGPSTQHYVADGVPFLTGKNVRFGRLLLDRFDRVSHAFHDRERTSQLKPNDVVVVRIGRSGEAAVIPSTLTEANCGGLVIAKKPTATSSEYLAWYLNSPRGQQQLLQEVRGVTRQPLNTKCIAAAVVPIPPAPEQHRIVERIGALLVRVNAARQRLAKVSAIRKWFRQSVLAAACSGRLNADWRADDDADDYIPETWKWRTVGEIAKVCLGGTPSRKTSAFWGGDVPWVSSGEVANCRITNTRERITKKGLKRSNAKVCPPGSVLIATIGEGKTRGQTAILDIAASTNQNVAVLIVDSAVVEPEYVWRWALGEYEKHRSGGRGGSYPALNGRLVREFEIPIPPLAEQHEIVRRVEALFRLADAIEKRVAAATARAEKLTQAILAKAFRGELVPTEAELARREGRSYEPASVLLDRIRTEWAAVPAPQKRPARRREP